MSLMKLRDALERFWENYPPPKYVDTDEELNLWDIWLDEEHSVTDGDDLIGMLRMFWDRPAYFETIVDVPTCPIKSLKTKKKQEANWDLWVKGAEVEVVINWFPRSRK